MKRSLTTRVLVAAGAVLIVFLGLTVFALDLAFRSAGERAVRDRLQIQLLALISAAELGADGSLLMPDELPEARFGNPGSGLFAQIADSDGAVLWRSTSTVGTVLPTPASAAAGARLFERARTADGDEVFVNALTVTWDTGIAGTEPRTLTFAVAETMEPFQAQMTRFRVNLSGWFGLVFAGLIVAQLVILRRTLRPLRTIALEVAAIEGGKSDSVSGGYPRELQRLAGNLNALIRNERAHLARYRDTLGDLAHSIKTPLAVIRVAMEEGPGDQRDRTIREQVTRINEIVDFHLKRAREVGKATFGRAFQVEPEIDGVIASMRKVHHDRGLRFEQSVDPALRFRGDRGELLEVLGNLLDNACKWARSRVTVSAHASADALFIEVADDGPGIPEDRRSEVLGRGVRADESIDGQGIGLAVVSDIVARHGGTLTLDRAAIGGLQVRATFLR